MDKIFPAFAKLCSLNDHNQKIFVVGVILDTDQLVRVPIQVVELTWEDAWKHHQDFLSHLKD